MPERNITDYVVYSIHDPRSDRAFYIGQTVNLPRRICEHLKLRDKASSASYISDLLDGLLVPIFRIIAVCSSRQEADRLEFEEIAIHLAAGFELKNSEREMNHARMLLQTQPHYIAQRVRAKWPAD